MIRLRALDVETGEIADAELPLAGPGSDCELRLRCLPGASAIHLALADADADADVDADGVRVEVPADGGETVSLRVALEEGGAIAVSSPGRPVLTLAPDARYQPSTPLRVPPPEAPLDLALVVDGTLRLPPAPGEDGGEDGGDVDGAGAGGALAAHADRLAAFVHALAGGAPEARVAVIAFGDEPPPQARAEDLLPSYKLHPETQADRRLRPYDPAHLRAELGAVPATSGGDFVDALADALAACRDLHWRPEARKLLLVAGDSPGHSLLHPPPPGADAQVRDRDVDEEAFHLHQQGVELATLYHPPPWAGELEPGGKRHLLNHAAAQYRRLASRPELAFVATDLDPEAVAGVVGSHRGILGREASWGERIEVG